jgi:hypothetical protein
METQPAFTDLADLVGYAPLTDAFLQRLSHNAKFAMVRCEFIPMGFYGPSDTVPAPESPVDGYQYSYAECLFIPIMYSSRSPAGGYVPGQATPPPLANSDSGKSKCVVCPYILDVANGSGLVTVQTFWSETGAENQGTVKVIAVCQRGSVVTSYGGGPATAFEIVTGSLPSGTDSTAYYFALAAQYGTAPYTWSITSGALPSGLTMSSAGVISGTPTVSGSFSITVQATDSATPANTATATLALYISPAGGTLEIGTASSFTVHSVDGAFQITLFATGGEPPYYWTLISDSSGLMGLTEGGLLTAQSITPGVYTCEVTVLDSSSPQQTATQTFTITVT